MCGNSENVDRFLQNIGDTFKDINDMYRSKTSWNTNLLHFISSTHREMDTSDQNFRISDGSDPEVSRLVAWSGSDTPAFVFILAVAQTVKRQLSFQYNSLVLMHKHVWKTLHASCNQAVCVFPGTSGPCERSRREKSCFIPIWVVSSLGWN